MARCSNLGFSWDFAVTGGAGWRDMPGAPALRPWTQVVRRLCAGFEVDAHGELLGGIASPLAVLLPELAQTRKDASATTRTPDDGDHRDRFFDEYRGECDGIVERGYEDSRSSRRTGRLDSEGVNGDAFIGHPSDAGSKGASTTICSTNSAT